MVCGWVRMSLTDVRTEDSRRRVFSFFFQYSFFFFWFVQLYSSRVRRQVVPILSSFIYLFICNFFGFSFLLLFCSFSAIVRSDGGGCWPFCCRTRTHTLRTFSSTWMRRAETNNNKIPLASSSWFVCFSLALSFPSSYANLLGNVLLVLPFILILITWSCHTMTSFSLSLLFLFFAFHSHFFFLGSENVSR